MKNENKNTVKQAMSKIKEAVELLQTINGENLVIDEAKDNIDYAYSDLEYLVNND